MYILYNILYSYKQPTQPAKNQFFLLWISKTHDGDKAEATLERHSWGRQDEADEEGEAKLENLVSKVMKTI